MESWFQEGDVEGEVVRVHAARLAIRVLLAGFRSIEELAGLSTEACQKLTNIPKELSMLKRTVADMDAINARARAEQLRQTLGIKEPAERGPRSAWELAATLSEDELRLLEQSTQEMTEQLGVSLQQGPRAATQQLIAARQAGRMDDVEKMMTDRELQLRLSQQRKSLPQVAAGLRAWHLYATGVHGYDERPHCLRTHRSMSVDG